MCCLPAYLEKPLTLVIWSKFRSIFVKRFTEYIFSKSVLEGKMFNSWLFQYSICWHQLVKTAVVGGDPLLVSGLRSDFFLCSVNYCAQFSVSSDLVGDDLTKSVIRSGF